MNKSTTIIERRKELIEISKVAKALREAEEIDGTINYVLLNYMSATVKVVTRWKLAARKMKSR